MPDREVKTVRDLIYYQYAKIIARRAFSLSNGKSAKEQHYGFIKKTFRDLKSGKMSWSEITREDWQLFEAEKKCAYCGTQDELNREHLIPRSLKIKPECCKCDRIQQVHNQVLACGKCNSLKSTMGLYEFFKSRNPNDPKFYDIIPPLVEKKYLKTIYYCHECAGTLDKQDIDQDGVVTVLEIDLIIHA